MKVNAALWLCIVSAVFLSVFEFANAATTATGKRTSTQSPKSTTTPASAPEVTSRRSRRKPTTPSISSSTEGPVKKSISSSRTGGSRLPPPEKADGSKPKGVRQLDIPKNRKKNLNPKKYTVEEKNPFPDNLNGPTKVDLLKPTFNNEKRSTKNPRDKLICPKENEVKFDLFPVRCDRDRDCKSWTTNQICCDIFGAKSCVAGLPKPLEESTHSPIFGFIVQRCPQRPLAELWWEVKVCKTDADCWPRVCCPDGQNRYCRSAKPELEKIPVPVKRSLNYLSEYLECTPPPPPIFDLHPKPCNSTFDCFPNVCCQEAGKKHCRPPKKSVLTFMANFLNLGLVKRLTKNLVIK